PEVHSPRALQPPRHARPRRRWHTRGPHRRLHREVAAPLLATLARGGGRALRRAVDAALGVRGAPGGAVFPAGLKPAPGRDQRRLRGGVSSSTGRPRAFGRGRTPRPGSEDATMRPFRRCGAPSAVLTV